MRNMGKYDRENQGKPNWAKIYTYDYEYKCCSKCGWAVQKDQAKCPHCQADEFRDLNEDEKDRLNRNLSNRNAALGFFD